MVVLLGFVCSTDTRAADTLSVDNGAPTKDLSGAPQSRTFFKILVPANQAKLVIRTFGGSGNCNLYAEKDAIPSDARYDYRSESSGNVELLTINDPAPGEYFILLYGASGFSGVTLVATYEPLPPPSGHYYALSPLAGTWQQVEAQAVSFGGHLVSITNPGEQRFVMETFLVGENAKRTYWIGLTDREREGVFKWVDGEPFDYRNWNQQEPNNCGDEDYGPMNWHVAHARSNSALGDWNDAPNVGSDGCFFSSPENYRGIIEFNTRPQSFPGPLFQWGETPAPPLSAVWTIPPPNVITAGQSFQVSWTVTGNPARVSIRWHAGDPTTLKPEQMVKGSISDYVTGLAQPPLSLTAPIKHPNGSPLIFPTTVRYVVHVANDQGETYSSAATVTVDPRLAFEDFAVDMRAIGGTAGSTPPTIPDPPSIPPYERGKDSLVFVTHGRTPELPGDLGWVDDMAQGIRRASGVNWQVMGYKWPNESHASIFSVLTQARNVGESVGRQIVQTGMQTAAGYWKHVHLIAHSAGSELIEKASELIQQNNQSTVIHTTFLDPYEGVTGGGWKRYGLSSHWSDNYFASDRETWDPVVGRTEGRLQNAHNVEVTALDPDAGKTPQYCASPSSTALTLGNICGYRYYSIHNWPFDFYLQTVERSDWPEAKGYGFRLSKEAGGWLNETLRELREKYPVGNQPIWLGPAFPIIAAPPEAPRVRFDPVLDLALAPRAVSESGVATLERNGFVLQTRLFTPLAAQPERGIIRLQALHGPNLVSGPAWLSLGTIATNRISFIRFQAAFLNPAAAQGRLTVLWNNDLIGAIDERQAQTGLQEYSFAVTHVVPDKINVLGFRLDALSWTPSAIAVTNVITGFAGLDAPYTLSAGEFDKNRGFRLILEGASGHNYLLETSTNLSHWQPVAMLSMTNSTATSGSIQFDDPTAATASRRFYRVVSP